jgi:hypothetical protein
MGAKQRRGGQLSGGVALEHSHSTLKIYSAANVTISVIRCSCTSVYTPAVATLWRAQPLRFSTSQHFRRLYISKLERLYQEF